MDGNGWPSRRRVAPAESHYAWIRRSGFGRRGRTTQCSGGARRQRLLVNGGARWGPGQFQLVHYEQPVGVGAVIPTSAVVVPRFMGVPRFSGVAVLVPVFPDQPALGVGGSLGAGFVMNHAILHPANDRFDGATKEEGDESDNRTHAAGTGATGQHPFIVAEEEAKRQPFLPCPAAHGLPWWRNNVPHRGRGPPFGPGKKRLFEGSDNRCHGRRSVRPARQRHPTDRRGSGDILVIHEHRR